MNFRFKQNSFVAWMLRMTHIARWPLMHNLQRESVAEHSHAVSVIAHTIAMIGKHKFGKTYDPAQIALVAMYHESSESAGIGDIPSPVKYANEELTDAIKALEHNTEMALVQSLPDFLQDEMRSLLVHEYIDPEVKALVKSADNISAYIKAHGEVRKGNGEFKLAAKKLRELLNEQSPAMTGQPEVQYFIQHFLPHCEATLDELVGG